MSKIRIFVNRFIIFCLKCALIESIELKCEFGFGHWAILGRNYRCHGQNQGNLVLDRTNREIHSVIGTHEGSNSNADIKGVDVSHSIVHYFPRGFAKFFPNIEGLACYDSELREITYEDFKDYKNLREINIRNNHIKFFEGNLFENNPKLVFIFADNNDISHIDSNTFDNFIGKMTHLWLSGNNCEFENADNNKGKVNQVIAKIQNGFCKDESKLPQTRAVTTTTTTALNSQQFNEMKNEIKFLKEKVNNQDKDLQAIKEKLEKTYSNFNVLVLHVSEVKNNIFERLTPRNPEKSAGNLRRNHVSHRIVPHRNIPQSNVPHRNVPQGNNQQRGSDTRIYYPTN